MTSDKNVHSKIVLDYSFCNASNAWNYLGVITIILFFTILLSFLKHRHHKNNLNSVYIIALIILGLVFVIPFMCWLLTLVEILVTFIRYGQIPASPLPMLTLPIRALAFVYTKVISTLHLYLTAPGTFIFLLFFMACMCIKLVILLVFRFGLPGFFLCLYIGFAMPLYALSEVSSIDSWVDLAFNSQLPLFLIYKFRPLLLAVKSRILWPVLFAVFLLACHLKFGVTLLFVCKCCLAVVLVRFSYVIGTLFIRFVLSTSLAANAGRTNDDVQ